MRVVGLIPARYASKRFPGKALADLCGKPLLQHVVERASQAKNLSEVVVATDDMRIADAVRRFGGKVQMTAPTHPSGTDRIAEVARDLACDLVVNIQGDEPLITPGHIGALVQPFQRRPETQVATLKIRAAPEEVTNPDVVKVVVGAQGNALYFSRLPIPFDRDRTGAPTYWKHLGIYAYRREALESFHRFPPSPLETAERLEQLRFLENGIPIQVVETAEPTIGVDTEADLRAVEAYLKSRPQ